MHRTLQSLMVAFVTHALVSSTPIGGLVEAAGNDVLVNFGDDGHDNMTVADISSRQLCGSSGWQINYYWDGGCSDYAGEADFGKNDAGIFTYNYEIAGTWSNSLVHCPGQSSSCALYSDLDGNGQYLGTINCGFTDQNCVSNGGVAVRSLKCFSEC